MRTESGMRVISSEIKQQERVKFTIMMNQFILASFKTIVHTDRAKKSIKMGRNLLESLALGKRSEVPLFGMMGQNIMEIMR
jgi:hypothetical protein